MYFTQLELVHGRVVVICCRYVAGLSPAVKSDVDSAVRTALVPGRSVVVCHSAPGFWFTPATLAPCPPDGSSYYIGRTMFEVGSALTAL